ncbi:hypothetical protein KY363_02200, partial [Candidatus Woesearchaeota archaeon]|nr:hypothetical protein [Candidatus Woesearchaeota archaeon]
MKYRNKLRAMQDHLADERQKLASWMGEEEPYFVSCLLLSRKQDHFVCSSGAIVDEGYNSDESTLRLEVRVGNYDFDGKGSISTDQVPVTDDYVAMRNLLWSLTRPAYHFAQKDYLARCRDAVDSEKELRVKSFAKVDPVGFEDEPKKRNDRLVER